MPNRRLREPFVAVHGRTQKNAPLERARTECSAAARTLRAARSNGYIQRISDSNTEEWFWTTCHVFGWHECKVLREKAATAARPYSVLDGSSSGALPLVTSVRIG